MKELWQWRQCIKCGIKFRVLVCPNCIIKKLRGTKNSLGFPQKNGMILRQPLTDWDGIKQFKFKRKFK